MATSLAGASAAVEATATVSATSSEPVTSTLKIASVLWPTEPAEAVSAAETCRRRTSHEGARSRSVSRTSVEAATTVVAVVAAAVSTSVVPVSAGLRLIDAQLDTTWRHLR